MKRIRFAAVLFAALLLCGLARNARAQYLFVGGYYNTFDGAFPALSLYNQTTGSYFTNLTLSGSNNWIQDMKTGPDGNVYAVYGNSFTMMVLNGANGSILRTVTLPYVAGALAFGPDGNIYIGRSSDGIYKLQGPAGATAGSPVGKLLGKFVSTGTASTAAITSMTFHAGSSGCELLACVGGTVARYSTQGVFLGSLPSSVAIKNISVGPTGDIFAWYQAGLTGNFKPYYNWIGRYSGQTYQFKNVIASLGTKTSTGQSMTMAWGPDNNLYVANAKADNTFTDNIFKIVPANDAQGKPDYSHYGTVSTFLNQQSAGNFPTPLCLAFIQQPLGQPFPQAFGSQLAFRETGGSVWGPGQTSATASYFLGPTWDTGGTRTAGGFYHVFILGDFGATVSANTRGKAGLNFFATAESGTVNINYPVEVGMDFGDRNYLFAGDWNTVYTSYKIDPAANLGTLPPTFRAGVDAVFNGYFRAEAEARAFDATLAHPVITPPAGSDISGNGFFDYGRNILNTDSLLNGQTTRNYSLLNGIITGYVKKPTITTAGMPNPNAADPRVIQSTGQDTFFNVRGSVSNLVREIIQDTTGVYVPIGTDTYSEHFLGSGFDLGYSFLDLFANVDVNVKQDFKFAPTPHIKLQLPAGKTINWRNKSGTQFNSVNALEFDAGDTIQIQMPSDPILQFTPTYTLPNAFTHTVSIVINPSLKVNPLELTATGSVFGHTLGTLDFHPIDTITLASTSINIPIVTRNFTLPGFQSVTQQGITVSGRLHPAPALASAMPADLPLIIVPYLFNSTTLPTNVTNGVTNVKIMGTGFPASGSQAYFTIHGSQPLTLATSTLDNCTLSVDIPNKYLLIAGTGQIYVTIPNAAGNSNSLNVRVVNPIPAIHNTGPNVFASDPNLGGNLLLTVTDDSTTFLWSANYYQIVKSKWFNSFNSSMQSFFAGYDFNEVTPLPAIHFKGSDGVDQTLAMYQEANPSGLLWAVLPLELYAKPDTAQISVVSPGPGGGVSNVLPLTIGTAVPQITSLSPSSVLPGSATFRLEVLGPLSPNTPPGAGPYGNFNGASQIVWDGQTLSTTFVTAGDLYADVPNTLVSAAGTHTVKVVSTVLNGQGGGTTTLTSNTLSFGVKSNLPLIAAVRSSTIALYPNAIVSADGAFVGAPDAPQFNLTVNGQGFDAASVVQWNGTVLTTQFVNDTTLAAAVPYAKVQQPGSTVITIANATAGGGGGVSNGATLTITNAKPGDTTMTALAATALLPGAVPTSGSSAALTVQGEGFYPGSVVNVNGAARATTFNSHSNLTITLTAADLATARNLSITVTNPAPGGGTTAALTLPVGPLASGTLTFADLLSTAPAQNVTFTLRPSDSSGNIVRTLAVPANGVFALGGLPRKNFTVHIKGEKFLAVNVAANLTSANVTNLTATLVGGDATNDNAVDIGDFGALVNAYNGQRNVSGSGYDVRADFNGDGIVDIGDFGILVNNYNAVGAN